MFSQNYKIFLLLILSILINFYTPIPFYGFEIIKKRNFINRLYMSLFTGFIIVLTDIILNKDELTMIEFLVWLIFVSMGIIITYNLINNQIFVDEKEFLLTLKENHEMDIHMTNKLIKNQKLDKNGIDYANKIIKNRNEEIKYNENILDFYL